MTESLSPRSGSNAALGFILRTGLPQRALFVLLENG
jgi:hypothetical protein